MAVKATLTTQMPWVGTDDQAAILTFIADAENLSKASVIRAPFDFVFGLKNGRLPEGVTVEQAAARGRALLEGTSPHAATAPA